VARSAGIGLYGGCLLESSIGAAAHLHVQNLPGAASILARKSLTGDLVTEPLRFADFHIRLPTGPVSASHSIQSNCAVTRGNRRKRRCCNASKWKCACHLMRTRSTQTKGARGWSAPLRVEVFDLTPLVVLLENRSHGQASFP
jgi:hypothetical protein